MSFLATRTLEERVERSVPELAEEWARNLLIKELVTGKPTAIVWTRQSTQGTGSDPEASCKAQVLWLYQRYGHQYSLDIASQGVCSSVSKNPMIAMQTLLLTVEYLSKEGILCTVIILSLDRLGRRFSDETTAGKLSPNWVPLDYSISYLRQSNCRLIVDLERIDTKRDGWMPVYTLATLLSQDSVDQGLLSEPGRLTTLDTLYEWIVEQVGKYHHGRENPFNGNYIHPSFQALSP